MTRDEFEIQREIYFHNVQWNLVADYPHRFVWSREVFGEIKPYLDFLDFFVKMKWDEIDDEK
jgi:hypothetical protein